MHFSLSSFFGGYRIYVCGVGGCCSLYLDYCKLECDVYLVFAILMPIVLIILKLLIQRSMIVYLKLMQSYRCYTLFSLI